MSRPMIRYVRGAALAVLIGVGLVLPGLPAPSPAAAATTFVVNTVADPIDADGVCEPAPGDCTLREAIQAANANPGLDTIAFAIPGNGVQTIKPHGLMQQITDPVIIDGYTQPGAKPNTAGQGTNAVLTIELDGSQAGEDAKGLVIQSDVVTVRGLVVNSFDVTGISVEGGTGHVVEGNFVGTDPTGTVSKGNGFLGIAISENATDVQIGGAAPAALNLVSANRQHGVEIVNAGRVTIEGNLIGTDRSGQRPLGSQDSGVAVGLTANSRVVGNTIAFSDEHGILVQGGVDTRLQQNAIFANGEVGIDLGDDGRTLNDPGDADEGPNNLQNFPVLQSATAAKQTKKGKKKRKATITTVRGALNSQPNSAYLIEFFANPPGQDAQGKTLLGQRQVRTGADGNAAIAFTVKQPLRGQLITTIATDQQTGATSELSDPVTVKKGKKNKKGKKGKNKKGKRGRKKARATAQQVGPANAAQRAKEGKPHAPNKRPDRSRR